ncbi:MAG: DUF3038 domain-containing protein, partial [Microcystaceae cyanobacterium]
MALAVSSELSTANWQNLPLLRSPNDQQLAKMQLDLDLLFLALVALADLDIKTVQLAVGELGLQHLLLNPSPDSRLSHPKYWRVTSGEVLSLEEVRSLVLLICNLAHKHQELLRRSVTLMEQMEEQGKDAAKTVLLGNYLDNFQELYRGYRPTEGVINPLDWQYFSFKQLIDLLFYGARNGDR